MSERKRSHGGTFDIKPPKSFKKKGEADFRAEEEAKKAPKTTPDNNKKSKNKKQQASKLRLISQVFSILALIINGVFLFRILSTSVLPAKYAYTLLAFIVTISLFYFFKTFRKKTKKITLVILDILAILLSAGFLFTTSKINELFDFLDTNFRSGNLSAVYNVVVNKESKYNSLADIEGKTIETYDEIIKDISDDELEKIIKRKIKDSKLSFIDDIDELMGAVLDDKTAVILINEETYGSYADNEEDYAGKVKIIAQIDITVSIKEEPESESESVSTKAAKKDLTNTPFILYISGIDTHSNKMPSRSLSDVNILIAINPNTKKIAMVTTPRDFYVRLHGTTGLKDKLTHAGIRGGIKLSKATIEDFYGVKIDRHIRVNFRFVVKLIDAIGGITINNDSGAFAATPELFYNKTCSFKSGINSVDGICALAFARERMKVAGGDKARGRHQMHVIEQILKKITSGTTFLSKYSQIMKSLEGTFDTNISTSDITSLVRMQLDDMAKWTVESYSVSGTDAMEKTYSYPNKKLFVFRPDMSTVETAKKLNNKTLSK